MKLRLTQRGRKPSFAGLLRCLAILQISLLTACRTDQSASVRGEQELASPTGKPVAVYVTDFELWAGDITHQEGPVASRPGPVGQVGRRLSGASTDLDSRARELVNLMADSLVRDLSKAGLVARRLSPGSRIPAEGWLVRGCFIQVEEGNRLQRSIIGFGHGETEVQVVANLDDLTEGTLKPLYQIITDATTGRKPSAGATLAFTPWGAVVHYVRGGTDLETNIQQTASQIAAQVTRHLQAAN